MARATLFVDTGYVIALVSPRDRFHAAAVEWAGRIKRDNILLVTSRAVQLEFGAALSRTPHRAIAIDLLDEMERDPEIEIAPLSEALFQSSLQLFRDRTDKDWSLTDCVSFTLMRQRAITVALTTDAHFIQAGFEAVLLN